MPSATCELNSPDSYVWQPNEARKLSAPPCGLAKWNVSMSSLPRIDEPSVYDTPYEQTPPSHERHECMPATGCEQLTRCAVVERRSSKRAPDAPGWRCAPQCMQSAQGSAVSALPVSIIKSKDSGGVPRHTSAEK